jgi:membrane fusion protein, multidrug efflux system
MTKEGSPAQGGRRVLAAVTVAILVVAAGLGVLLLRKHGREARESQARRAEAAAGAPVRAVTVQMGSPTRTVSLIGEVRALRQSTLYAKLSGYVTSMKVDKGDKVRDGQVLAVVESPDAAEQVASAEADVALRQQVARRAETLAPSGVVSDQDVEQAETALKVAEAGLAQARVKLSYASLRAPFTGRITARYVDEGTLVAAATGSTTSVQPLLEIANMDRVRVQVYLPQDDALRVRTGDDAVLVLDRGGEIPAQVTRMTRSLDPRTRTMLVEMEVPNDPPRMYPGEFVQVQLRIARPARPVVPSAALTSRGGTSAVAVVEGGRVRFVPVVTGEHDGANVEIVQGLVGGERVALDAGGLSDGAPVQPVEASPAPAARGAP